jgi:hypothetical protein
MKSSFHIQFLSCHLLSVFQLSSLETLSVIYQLVCNPHYIVSGQIQRENTVSMVIAQQYLDCCLLIYYNLNILLSHCLAMNVYSGSAILAFKSHVTV